MLSDEDMSHSPTYMFDGCCAIGWTDGGAKPPLGELDSGIVTYGDPCGSFIDFNCLSFLPKILPKVDLTPFFLAAAWNFNFSYLVSQAQRQIQIKISLFDGNFSFEHLTDVKCPLFLGSLILIKISAIFLATKCSLGMIWIKMLRSKKSFKSCSFILYLSCRWTEWRRSDHEVLVRVVQAAVQRVLTAGGGRHRRRSGMRTVLHWSSKEKKLFWNFRFKWSNPNVLLHMHDQIVVSCQVNTRCSKLCGWMKHLKNGQNRKTGFEWSRFQRAKLSTKKLEEKPVKVQANKSKVPTVSNVPRKSSIPIVSTIH